MSEHTEGKIEAFTEPEFSGWWALREITDDGVNHEVGSGDGGLFEPDARRLAAAWNACEGMTTEAIEALDGIGSLGNLKASELAAARALLRDVRDFGLYIKPDGIMDNEGEELTSRIYDYLDACDTREGAPNAG